MPLKFVNLQTPDNDSPFKAPTDNDRAIAAKYPMSYTRLRIRTYDYFHSARFERHQLYVAAVSGLGMVVAVFAAVAFGWNAEGPAWPWW